MQSWHDEFPVVDNLVYLNHAAVAPWPRRTAEAVNAFAAENVHHGATGYPHWVTVERRLKKRAARLIGVADASDIALLKNTSEGLSVVAHGLAWQRGDNVVGIRQEFPSNRLPWESLADQGVEFRPLDLSTGGDPEQGLMDLCDDRTRIVAVSAVQFANGLRLNLESLGAFCRNAGILLCVDAIQQLGALPFDATRVNADVVVADGHKWMLGPEGLALFYVRPEVRDRLRLHQFGWHMREELYDFTRESWQTSPTASRFECGSPNMLSIHALDASLSLIEEAGVENIADTLLAHHRWLSGRVMEHDDLELLSPTEPERTSGILTFRHRRLDNDALADKLNAEGVICAARGGGVRFSPHFYTPVEQLERAWDILLRAMVPQV
ncbi:MAG: aminotransferase class V-fold PLP-dependent enzyme [Pseudomonadota bacterium]